MTADDQKVFSASMDRVAKIVTGVLATAAVGLLLTGTYWMWFRENTAAITAGLPWFLPGAILSLIVVVCRSLRITGYEVQDRSLKIRRPVMPLGIEYTQIREVLTPSPAQMSGSIRLFGSGGVFGYFGTFRNSEFGMMRWYATRTSNWILLIDAENKKLVLTPDDLNLAEEIRKRCFAAAT